MFPLLISLPALGPSLLCDIGARWDDRTRVLWCVCLSTLAVQTFCSCTAGTDRQTDGSPTDIAAATTTVNKLTRPLCFLLVSLFVSLQLNKDVLAARRCDWSSSFSPLIIIKAFGSELCLTESSLNQDRVCVVRMNQHFLAPPFMKPMLLMVSQPLRMICKDAGEEVRQRVMTSEQRLLQKFLSFQQEDQIVQRDV